MLQALTESVLERFKNSPLVKQLESDAQAELLAKRKTLVRQRAQIVEAHDKAIGPLRDAEQTAADQLASAEARVRDLRQALRQAHAAARDAVRTTEAKCNAVNRELKASADTAALELFVRSLEDTREGLHVAGFQETEPDGSTTYYSNKASVDLTRQRIGEARRAAQALAFDAVDLPKALAAIRAGIPAVAEPIKIATRPWQPKMG